MEASLSYWQSPAQNLELCARYTEETPTTAEDDAAGRNDPNAPTASRSESSAQVFASCDAGDDVRCGGAQQSTYAWLTAVNPDARTQREVASVMS